MMGSKEFIAGFIELYRINECLWKVTTADYTNKNKKWRAYQELIEFCQQYDRDADMEFVKKKIQNLKTAFRKELKKVKDSQASVGYEPPLDNGLDIPNIKNEIMDNTDETFTEEDDANQSKQMRLDEAVQSESLDCFLPTITPKSLDLKNAFRRSSKQYSRFQPNILLRPKEDDCPSAADTISKTNNDADEFSAMAITWASKLRKLNEEQQVLADGLINEILQKAYFNELTRTTAIVHRTD